MKTALIVVGIIIILGAGYLFFMQPATEAPNTAGDQAKIDINAVCEGALAYMTFPSGAEAEVWVQKCKEGKHPEAIEQWKQQNGITDDRAI